MTPAFSHLPCMNISEQMSRKVSFAGTGKFTLKIFTNNKERVIIFQQPVFSDLNFALLSLGYVSVVRLEIIPCRFSHPAVFALSNKGRQIVDTTSQNLLYEVSAFVLFSLNQ